MTSIDFPSVRQGIANVLSTIPELKRVHLYGHKGDANNSLPSAHLFRLPVDGPGLSLDSEAVGDEGLGQYTHLITWQIEIRAAIRNEIDAQQTDDLFTMRLLDAFNANRLLDPNGPGVVDNSRLMSITQFEQIGGTNVPVWVSTATLLTKILSTL